MSDRCAPPGADDLPVRAIEVDFAIPVYVTLDQRRRLDDLLHEIASAPANQPVEGVHWVSGCGSKPRWSQTDARLLGKDVDPAAPVAGEPTFDDEVLHFETTARPFVSDDERASVEARRKATQEHPHV